MSSLNESFRELVNKEYNEEPVKYCKKCLSLKILGYEDTDDFCDDCGSTVIGETDIFTWEKMYENKYQTKFLK